MEFTDAQIRDFAGSDEQYEEAKRLVDEQRIASLDIDDSSPREIIVINATVKDEKNYRGVSMSIDKDDVTVHAHLYSCLQHGKDTLSCEHCTAVLIKLNEEHEKKQKEMDAHTAVQQHDSYAISLMNACEEQIIYSSLAMNLKQAVHIEPILEIRQRTILVLTLKVGNTKRYIIKDIAWFLDDIRHDVKKSHDKKLEFLHNRLNFDEESQKLLDFMLCREYDVLYFQNRRALECYPQARNPCMTSDAFDEPFQLYAGENIMHRMKEKMLVNMHFLDENPKPTMEVKKQGDDSHEIALSSLSYRIFGGRNCVCSLMDHILYRCDTAYSETCSHLLWTCLEKEKPPLLNNELMPTFYNNAIMNTHRHIPLRGVDVSALAPLPLKCHLYIDILKHNVISARLTYRYGNEECNAFSASALSTSKNFNDEIVTQLVFTRYMTRIDAADGIAYIEHSQDAMYGFLNQGLRELGNTCEIFAMDKSKKLQIRGSVNISMDARIKSDSLKINFNTYDSPVNELQEVLVSYRINEEYYRIKNSSFVSIEDSTLQEFSAILDGMHMSEKEISSGVIKVPEYRSLYIDNSLKDGDMIEVGRGSLFKDIVRGIRSVKDSDFAVPPALKSTLRNYQKIGLRWMRTIAAYGFSGILIDDMGIGKTLQIIILLEDERLQYKDSLPLVVRPSSLILNQQSEIEKFSKALMSIIVSDSSDERKVRIHNCKDYDIVIASYDYLKRNIEAYEDFTSQYQIIDEAQYIKDHSTKNAVSVKQIQARHRFALTETPVENSLAELWSIFDFLMPDCLYTYSYFRKQYEQLIVKEDDMGMLKELKRVVEPFILRRVERDVLKELPEKVGNAMLIELNEETRKLYMANAFLVRDDLNKSFKEKGFANSKIMILSILTRLRQLYYDPRLLYENYNDISVKISVCVESTESCRGSGKKVLLFSQFTSLLSLLEKELIYQDIPYYLLKRSTSKLQRQQLVNSFNSNDTPIFLISLKAGGIGLNLTSAEVVVYSDPWWNIFAQSQATDHAYRIGQHNNVQIVKLITKGVIEGEIMQLQSLKQDLSDSIIHNNEGIITSMSKEELMNLL